MGGLRAELKTSLPILVHRFSFSQGNPSKSWSCQRRAHDFLQPFPLLWHHKLPSQYLITGISHASRDLSSVRNMSWVLVANVLTCLKCKDHPSESDSGICSLLPSAKVLKPSRMPSAILLSQVKFLQRQSTSDILPRASASFKSRTRLHTSSASNLPYDTYLPRALTTL